jgi:hypothetical protein
VFKRFFGKKNDGFYLQLENEDATSKPDPKAKIDSKPAPVVAPAPTTVTDIAANPAVIAAPGKVSPAVAAAAAAVVKSNQQTAKAKEKAAKKNAKTAEDPASVVAPVTTAPAITNFATDYLMKPSSSSSRRLPGANMRGFLELARQVDKPKTFKAAASERKAGEK